MKTITAELLPQHAITPEDTENFVNWVLALKDKNNFDPEVMLYPRTVLVKALAGEDPILYVPLQPVLMFESLAPKPGISKGQIAMAMNKMKHLTEEAARITGHGEMFCLTNDGDEVRLFCRHGWTISLFDAEKQTYLLKRKVPQNPNS